MAFRSGIGRASAFGKKLAQFVIGAFALVSGVANAGLMVLDANQVLDSDLNIVWLRNANLAATNTFGVAGAGTFMDWDTAQAWIAGMNAAIYLGFSDWRLPNTVQPDATCASQFDPGFPFPLQGADANCKGSEMGHLFYTELGGSAGTSLSGSHGPFTDIQAQVWSGTESLGAISAWYFNFDNGFQNGDSKSKPWSAWAVRPGDVAAAPEPASLLLFGVGALGLAWSRRRGLRAESSSK